MSFNFINEKEYSFNSYLLMDRWIIRMILDNKSSKLQENLGIALYYNPVVAWYFCHKCKEREAKVQELINKANKNLTKEQVRAAEEYVLKETDASVVYVYPDVMNECEYIKYWDEKRLYELADFSNKVVLDIGSGTGRLAFAAAKKAKLVVASEPVDELREYMRDKIKQENIKNVIVVDGTVEAIPYFDDTFDITMSAHVVGDNFEKEIKEMTRVTKNGGYILDCMGEDDRLNKLDQDFINAGFSYLYYHSVTNGDVYRYYKKVIK